MLYALCDYITCLTIIAFCLPSNVFAVNLDDYRWRSRLLFLAAPEESDPGVRVAREMLERRSEELIEREVVVFQLFMHGQSHIGDQPIAAEQAQRIRSRLGIEPDERVLVLVGKDGGVKRRDRLLIDIDSVFRQIDAMPMRREEIRKTE